MSDSINGKRILYLDLLRICSIFSVVVLHVAAFNWSRVDINTYEWNVFNIYDSVVRWAVPVFVMISGALFLNKTKSIRDLYKKNILRIITAFIFWSIIYTIYRIVDGEEIKAAIGYLIRGHYHMWFLYMIVGLYMVTPFLKKIVENENLTKYFIVLAIIFSIVVPNIIAVVQIFSSDIAEFAQKSIGNLYLNMVTGYVLYYILGFLISSKNISRRVTKYIYLFGILGFVLTIFLTLIISRYTESASTLFYQEFTLNVFMESICIFVLFKNKFNKIETNTKVKTVIQKLSKYSFGAYLVHVLVIYLLNGAINLNSLAFDPALSIPIIAVTVFAISFCISLIMNHIPKINKYIV